MVKKILALLSCASLLILFGWGFFVHNDGSAVPGAPLLVVVNNAAYLFTLETVDIHADENEYLGVITSFTGHCCERPTENGQSNIAPVGSH